MLLAIWVGKVIFWLTRLLSVGGGSAAPGLYALKIDPEFVSKLTRQIPQQVVITGTNGKTTTARLLNHFVRSHHIRVLRNATGSNLERGIASALMSQVSLFGKISDIDLGIWELDEAAFNKTIFKIKPHLIVFLNAYRDQLDRYGEVDMIVKSWQESLKKVSWEPVILLNGGDAHVWSLAKDLMTEYFEFRVMNHQIWQESQIKGKEIKHRDDIVADKLNSRGLSGVDFRLNFNNQSVPISLSLPGIYHIYDFLAAFGIYYLLNLPTNNIGELARDYTPAFGRVEKIQLGKKETFIFLIKNPAGANQVLETISSELTGKDTLLLALNDNYADGVDVSWIWDAQFEQLNHPRLEKEVKKNENRGSKEPDFQVNDNLKVICSGTRAEDLALRLKYAGVETADITVISDLTEALKEGGKADDGRLFILPTYTALLELQKLLVKQKIKKEYWRE